jgi:glycosyltransferase involved in cell wall biosynthesis
MNLLVSCGVFHPRQGGAESLFFDLAGALARRGHNVTVVTRRFDDTAPTETIAATDGAGAFRIVRLRWPVPYERLRFDAHFLARSPQALWRALALLRSERIDTVCIGLLDMSAGYLLALRPLCRFRLVTYLHGAEIRDLPRQSRAFARLVASCLRASDAVVAVSQSLAERTASEYPETRGKLTVIPNGIDVPSFAAAPPLQRPRPYVLYVGRLAAEKNVALIVRAFARAAADIAGTDLVIAGTGPQHASIAALAASLGVADRVEMMGAVERARVFGLVKGALFLVLASDAESHPIVAVEAFAAGKAVIGPRVAGLTDIIDDGRNGALFEPGDEDALSALMVRYVRDADARAALERGVAHVDRARYDIATLAGEHLRVLGAAP